MSDIRNTIENIIPVFIKAIVFPYVGLSWIIQTKNQTEFTVDEIFTWWYEYWPRYNATICHNLHGPVFEDLFVTSHQDRYDLLDSLNTYEKLHEKLSAKVSTGGVIPFLNDYTKDSLQSLSVINNFIEAWLKILASTFA